MAPPCLPAAVRGPDPGLLRCTLCPKAFETRGKLNRHKKTHDKPYSCNECGEAFALRNDLDRHQTRHRPSAVTYQCHIKDCKFAGTSRRDNLRRHFQRRHGQTTPGPAQQLETVEEFCKLANDYRKAAADASSLHTAVDIGSEGLLVHMLEHGADVETRSTLGRTALHIAAQKGDVNRMRALIQYRADLTATDDAGDSVLHFAARSGFIPPVRFVLEQGASLASENLKGWTAARSAISEKCDEVAEYLVGKHINQSHVHTGSEISLPTSDWCGTLEDVSDHPESSLGDYNTMEQFLCLAAISGLSKTVNKLLQEWDELQMRSIMVQKAFIEAAGKCEKSTIELFLSRGIDVNIVFKSQPRSALSHAAKTNNEEVVHLLLKNAATDLAGALYQACLKGHLNLVRVLCEAGAPINDEAWITTMPLLRTPLKAAIQNGHEDVVQYLLNSDADVNTTPDRYHWGYLTPLESAAQSGHESIVRMLLAKDALPSPKALVDASSKGFEAIVRLLLDRNAPVNERVLTSTCVDLNWNNNALECASARGYSHIVQLLLNHGADQGFGRAFALASKFGHYTIASLLLEKCSCVDLTDALREVVENGQESVARTLLERGASPGEALASAASYRQGRGSEPYDSILAMLLEWGADPNSGNALCSASWSGRLQAVNMLLDKGADVNQAYQNGETALLAASRKGYFDVVTALLNRGAATNRITEWPPETALIAASRNGRTDIVTTLLDRGADVSISSPMYGTAEEAALKNGHFDIAELLRRWNEGNVAK